MHDEFVSEVRNGLQGIKANIDDGFKARKDVELEHAARLLAIEQRIAGGVPMSTASAPGGGGSTLGKAAEDIVTGLKSATSWRGSLPLSVKTLASDQTSESSLATALYPVSAANLGPVGTYHSPLVRLLDLMPTLQVDATNALTWVRVFYESPSGNAAAEAPELSLKPESSIDLEAVTVDLATYAHHTAITRQLLADVPALRGVLDDILRRGLLDVIDTAIFTAMTTGGNYTSFTAESNEVEADSVARVASDLAQVGGRDITICLNPADWLTMMATKASTAGMYLGMQPATLASRIVACQSVTAGNMLAFAPGSGPTWANRQNVTIEAGYSGDGFIKNTITLLCEARGAVLVRDAAHVRYGPIVAS